MTACEKCWRLAGGDPDRYRTLITESANVPCTPEEQAGPDATFCSACKRMTVHQYAHVCTACGHDDDAELQAEIDAYARDEMSEDHSPFRR